MITLITKIGSTSITGPTFSVLESRVDNIEILISNLGSLTSQMIHTALENEDEQFVEHGTSSENFALGVTVSIVLQSDDVLDIDRELNTNMGVKSVIAELLS